MRLDQKEADAFLAVLKRTPLFKKHPELVDAFNQCEYKRLMAHPDLHGTDMHRLASRLGGVLALAKSEPPPNILRDIIEVLDARKTYLLMCDTDEARQSIARQVDCLYPDGSFDHEMEITPMDTSHRRVAWN